MRQDICRTYPCYAGAAFRWDCLSDRSARVKTQPLIYALYLCGAAGALGGHTLLQEKGLRCRVPVPSHLPSWTLSLGVPAPSHTATGAARLGGAFTGIAVVCDGRVTLWASGLFSILPFFTGHVNTSSWSRPSQGIMENVMTAPA